MLFINDISIKYTNIGFTCINNNYTLSTEKGYYYYYWIRYFS